MNHAEHDRWQEAARHLLDVRRPEQAEHLVRRRLAKHPQEAEAHELLGLVLINQPGRTAEALTEIQQALALDPQSSDAHYFHSVLLLREGQPFAALQSIDEALHHDSLNATYLGFKAVILNTRRQPEAALEVATTGLRLNPGHIECLFQRILALQQLRSYEAASLTVGQLARWHPGLALTHALLGDEAMRAQQFAEAETHLREAIRLRPTDERTQRKLLPLLLQLGQEAQRQQKPTEARRYFLEAWHLSPGNSAARHGLEQLAQQRFWLKRQLRRLDAWSEQVQSEVKRGRLRAVLQLYLVLVPLVSLLCIPLIVAYIWAAVQWRLHPDVRMMHQRPASWLATLSPVAMAIVCLASAILAIALAIWLYSLGVVASALVLPVVLLVAKLIDYYFRHVARLKRRHSSR
ncbi:Flp pilus assembly protein TadD, contains TPR repeats [Hymenobacter gelipurpurascens]|uniref:Flp pilus assembly protein TadD, contains TPR repeats n=1 Tax=Hymenobacter gelipurpurascens TaxID=89968 RepID=A0A212TQ16_9BACT|nr:tetratricopeptide repeat protein [Hymenobacter gelipurpurascens]SNC68085.1 Flp pilus assembly protein TadD, contains TPR repeats [Hymenobacter gelipurpurascens]